MAADQIKSNTEGIKIVSLFLNNEFDASFNCIAWVGDFHINKVLGSGIFKARRRVDFPSCCKEIFICGNIPTIS